MESVTKVSANVFPSFLKALLRTGAVTFEMDWTHGTPPSHLATFILTACITNVTSIDKNHYLHELLRRNQSSTLLNFQASLLPMKHANYSLSAAAKVSMELIKRPTSFKLENVPCFVVMTAIRYF